MVRIRIRIKQPDLDLYQIEKQDPDPCQSEKHDPDPYQKVLIRNTAQMYLNIFNHNKKTSPTVQ
jgi:hypothetical protein